jgi:predicted transcriptional regulator
MTPRVFAVEAGSSFKNVVQEMLRRNVHNLFVVDEQGVLIGVITILDLLRHLLK